MSTYLQLLRLAFWMHPLQRWCTALGGVLLLLSSVFLAGTWPGENLAAFGGIVAFVIPALIGGALWRALSVSRMVGLAPHGRARVLLAAATIAATIALVWVVWQFLFDLGVPPQWRTGVAGYRQLFVATFAAATWWGLASFIASRSPLAMLLVLVVIMGSRVVFWAVPGMPTLPQLWWEYWGMVLPLLLWVVFGIWYLQERRIRPPGWLLPGGQSLFAAVAMTSSDNRVPSRPAALERLLLGGTSVRRLLAQWLLVIGLLMAVLLLLGRQGDLEARSSAHVAFAALILCPIVVAAVSAAVVRRARALWLPSGYSRGELFACIRTLLLKLALGMALVFIGLLLALWYTQPWRPSLTLPEAVLVMVLPPLLLATHLLTRPRGWDYWWRWPCVLVLCWWMAWRPLTSANPFSWTHSPGWAEFWLAFAGNPFGWAGARGWLMFTLAGVATIWFHLMARRRWQVDDLPRVVTSPAS